MPLYEYRCADCGYYLEALKRASAAPGGVTCPRCGASMQKQFSTFAPRGDRSASATQGVCQHKYGCACARK